MRIASRTRASLRTTTRATVRAAVRLSWVVVLVALAACAPLPSRSVLPTRQELIDRDQGVGNPDLGSGTYERIPRYSHRALPDPPSLGAFAPENASVAKRRDTVDRIWRTITSEFYDPSFNGADVVALTARSMRDADESANDADFYRALKRDVAALDDSHTVVLTPRQAAQSRTQRASQIGIGLVLLDGRVVVNEIVPGFSAEEKGVRVGMILEGVDRRPIDPAFLEQAAHPSPSAEADGEGEEPTDDAKPELRANRARLAAVRALLVEREGPPLPHRLTLRRRDDSVFDVEVLARTGDVPTIERFELLPSGIGVLRLSRFDGSKRRQLARDLDAARAQSRGLILDLRANPGGEVRLLRWLVGRFLDRDASVGSMVVRAGDDVLTIEIPGERSGEPYTAPLAVLTDSRTASAAEWAAYALVELREAVTVGESTCGCVVGVRREFVLPDNGVLRVAEVGFHSARDHRMEGEPLRPTIPAMPTLAQLRAGEDVPLQAAERALLSRVEGGEAQVVHAR